MATAYTYARTLNDESVFFNYIQTTFPTLFNSSTTNTQVTLTFTAALSAPDLVTLQALVNNYVDPITKEDDTRNNISIFNSVNTALAADAVWSGTWEDVSRYSTLSITYTSNVASALNGVAMQFGISAPQADITRAYTLVLNNINTQTINVLGRFFRVVYTNGATLQTSFRLSTFWSVTQSLPVVNVNAVVNAQNDALLTRSITNGVTDANTFEHVRVDNVGQLRIRPPRNFERMLVSQSVPLLRVNFTYGLNTETATSTVVSGTVTASSSRALVSSAAAINTSATVSSYKYIFCSPGDTIIVINSCAFGAATAGTTQLCGAGDTSDGLFWGYNGTAFGVAVRFNGTTTWTPQSSFNIDKLDGTGNSGMVLNPQFGNTYGIMYDTTGYGSALFMINSVISSTNAFNANNDNVYVHRVSFGNVSANVGVLNFQFPCIASVANTTNNTVVTMSVASLAAFSDKLPASSGLLRGFEGVRTVTTTTYVPMITLQNKTTFNALTNSSVIVLKSISIATRGSTRNVIVSIFMNPTLGGLTYVDFNATRSCISSSVTATGTITAGTGTLVFSACLFSAAETFNLADLDISIPPGSFCSVCCRLETGVTVNASASLTCVEFQ